MLLASNRIDGFVEVFGDIEFVKHDVGLGYHFLGRLDEGLPHVHGDGFFDSFSLGVWKGFPDSHFTFLGSPGNDFQDTTLLQIRQNRNVVPTLEKTLFIDSDVLHFLERTPNQPAFHRSPHNHLGRIPVQSQQVRCLLQRMASPNDFDGERLE
jgi:hypothetical protein